MEAGLDSKSVPSLASRRPSESLSDSYSYFLRILYELGYRLPEESELFEPYAVKIADDVVRGEIGEWEAVSLMHKRVVVPREHPARFQGWCDLWCTIDPIDPSNESDLGREQFREAVHALANVLVTDNAPN